MDGCGGGGVMVCVFFMCALPCGGCVSDAPSHHGALTCLVVWAGVCPSCHVRPRPSHTPWMAAVPSLVLRSTSSSPKPRRRVNVGCRTASSWTRCQRWLRKSSQTRTLPQDSACYLHGMYFDAQLQQAPQPRPEQHTYVAGCHPRTFLVLFCVRGGGGVALLDRLTSSLFPLPAVCLHALHITSNPPLPFPPFPLLFYTCTCSSSDSTANHAGLPHMPA